MWFAQVMRASILIDGKTSNVVAGLASRVLESWVSRCESSPAYVSATPAVNRSTTTDFDRSRILAGTSPPISRKLLYRTPCPPFGAFKLRIIPPTMRAPNALRTPAGSVCLPPYHKEYVNQSSKCVTAERPSRPTGLKFEVGCGWANNYATRLESLASITAR